MSSVHSSCTIIFKYLVARDINIIQVKLRCLHPTSVWLPLSEGWGASCPVWFILPPRQGFGSNSVISSFLLYHNLGIFSCKRCEHYFSQTEMFTSNISFVTLVRGVGGKLSRLVYLAPCLGFVSGSIISQFSLPPAYDLSQTMSSVNSYCTIILEYLVVRDINIISVKLRCLHSTSVWLPLSEGWGASCPGWFILPPAKELGRTVSSVHSYCTIILEYLVARDVNVISAKMRCLHPTSVWLPLSEM